MCKDVKNDTVPTISKTSFLTNLPVVSMWTLLINLNKQIYDSHSIIIITLKAR
jgi:hypothetical protein